MQILAVSSPQRYRSFPVMSVLAKVGLPDSIVSKQQQQGPDLDLHAFQKTSVPRDKAEHGLPRLPF